MGNIPGGSSSPSSWESDRQGNVSASRLWMGTAVLRGAESLRPPEDRLFHDPVSLALLPWGWRLFLRGLQALGLTDRVLQLRERRFPGVVGNLLCRTRAIDDILWDQLAEGLDQVALLGAGFDTRAYRTPGIEGVKVFEVDKPETQADKRKRLKKALGDPPEHVRFVPVDFRNQDLGQRMVEAGFQRGVRTFFIWEGVTQYLDPDAVDSVCRWVAGSGGAGSALVFTYIKEGVILGPGRSSGDESLMKLAEKNGAPWIFGIDPSGLGAFLSRRGFHLVKELGSETYLDRYLRPAGRELAALEAERVALAELDAPGRPRA